MARGHIYMLGANPDVSVLADQAFARNDGTGTTLIVPFKIEFSAFPGSYNKRISKAEVLFFKGQLRTENGIFCGESIIFINHPLSNNQRSFQSQFEFSFSYEVLNKIEKQRTGDLPLVVSMTGQVAIYEENLIGGNTSQSFITGFDKPSGHVNFVFPQSFWVNKLLTQTGHQSFRLIEIPTASQIIPTEYSTSLRELDEAKKYFINGDYDKTVAHCRSAIDPFKPRKDEIKKYVNSKSEFAWAKDVIDATDEYLLKLVKSTSHFASKTHHLPSIGHFDRKKAEILMMITTAIIAYIGKVG